MRVPLGWLKDYVDIKIPLEELAHRLTMAGIEVEAVERIGARWDKMYVGEVLEVRPHPNADRLTIAEVNYGGDKPLTVITGAPNIRVGDKGLKVPTALAGARLIDGHSPEHSEITLKPAKIRGVRSEGMICSELELGISDDHEGIMILDPEAPVGLPLADYLGDTIFHLELSPNLVRCLSLIGVAREVAALTGEGVRLPEMNLVAEGGPIEEMVSVEIEAPDLCPRYSASLITGLTVGPSPLWLQRRLRAAGMRPINNIVDVTNYVMLELNRPLHAFDYEKIRGKRIIVRRAGSDNIFTTLDGEERELLPDMLMIADQEGPVAVAGVMGGLVSEVIETTCQVLLESANFDRVSIRRTSQALKVRTEASIRFDKGLDPESTIPALRRASELIRQLAGGQVARGFADAYPRPREREEIAFTMREVERLLGVSVPLKEVARILESLEFQVEALSEERLRVIVPSHRGDVSLPADLVEEVARIKGYDEIPTTLLSGELPPQRINWSPHWERRAREVLAACGLSEVITYTLVNRREWEAFPLWGEETKPEALNIANPIVLDQNLLRTTLWPSLLKVLASNLRYHSQICIFEIGRVYLPQEGDLPRERNTLALALAGGKEKSIWGEGEVIDFYSLKGMIETLLREMGIKEYDFVPALHPSFSPHKVAHLLVGEEPTMVGILGESQVGEVFDLGEQSVYLAEIDFDALCSQARSERPYQPLPRYPAITQDIALVVDEGVPAGKVHQLIMEAGGTLLTEARLFDLYRGAPIPEGKKSLAYSLTYRAPDHTLTVEEVMKIQERIVSRLYEAIGARLRE
ncbi:MAG: phenylalanine--tRNA ligase subunit beta [Anaerolineae bacterium]|nr:phenylalanine--tRNA ligase subunit beta [Anaerolineae bacterium]